VLHLRLSDLGRQPLHLRVRARLGRIYLQDVF
jgi:hypothetical protein